jgi:hypothetical protein
MLGHAFNKALRKQSIHPLTYHMKFKLFLALFITISIRAFAQPNNTVAVVYGSYNTLVDIHNSIGDFGYNPKTGTSFGLTYTKKLSPLLSLQTGLIYADDKADENSDLPGRAGIYIDGDLKMISVPIIAKFTFFHFLYADAGLSLDKEINYKGNYLGLDQSGVGFEIGVGAQYTSSHITVFVNPYVKDYGLAHFSSKEDFNLLEDGFKFGLGYSF